MTGGDRKRRRVVYGVVALALVAIIGYNANADANKKQHPSHVYAPIPWSGGSYSYNTGYEDPAPGNDGSYDCPPGGGPIYVGSNDPANLDGDGDGIGCEA